MLTVLLQDDFGGLYVNIKGENPLQGNEKWIEIPRIHGALVINVGDSLFVKFHAVITCIL